MQGKRMGRTAEICGRPVRIMPLIPCGIGRRHSGLFFRFGLRQTAEDLLAFLPATVFQQHVNPLKTFENVSFFLDVAGGLQTGMFGHG